MPIAKCKSDSDLHLHFALFIQMLSIAIIARDEERHLPAALAGVGGWVLFLDADERVTDELRDEILQIVDCRSQIAVEQSTIYNLRSAMAGYWIPRYNQFFGRTLRGGG